MIIVSCLDFLSVNMTTFSEAGCLLRDGDLSVTGKGRASKFAVVTSIVKR